MPRPPPRSWSELLRRSPRFLMAVPEAVLVALNPVRMATLLAEVPPSRRRVWFALAGLVAVAFASTLLGSPVHRRAALIVGVVLVLWLSEVVPAFATALVLFAATPIALGNVAPGFALPDVLGWAADPVIALFFGGFALGAAARRHGLDASLARAIVAWSAGRRARLVLLLMGGTSFLGMWMSNTASAAMMLAASRPVLSALPAQDPLRRAVLVAIALGANVGGLSTPIGTPPNGIAVAQAARLDEPVAITFLEWLAFGTPLVVCLLAGLFVLLRFRYRLTGRTELVLPEAGPLTGEARAVLVLFALAIAAWVSEPLHGFSTPLVALVAGAALFGSGLLTREDMSRIDWSTLVFVGGSIVLGRVVQSSGLVELVTGSMDLAALSPAVRTTGLVLVTALVGSFLSNTATATLFVPLAATVDGTVGGIVLVAIAASLGVPFIFSTPPNAMAYGEGGLRPSDLFVPGILLVLIGGLVIALTGPWVLQLTGL